MFKGYGNENRKDLAPRQGAKRMSPPPLPLPLLPQTGALTQSKKTTTPKPPFPSLCLCSYHTQCMLFVGLLRCLACFTRRHQSHTFAVPLSTIGRGGSAGATQAHTHTFHVRPCASSSSFHLNLPLFLLLPFKGSGRPPLGACPGWRPPSGPSPPRPSRTQTSVEMG